jgi:hypothetical protein
MNRPHMLDPLDEIPDALEAQPEGFYVRFAVTFSSEEAAEHGDLPDDVANHAGTWLAGIMGRRNKNVAAVALANKNARIVWALLAHDREYASDYALVV